MNFRLLYEGALPSNGTAKDKQAIRRVLHPQLAQLWKEPPLLAFVERNQHTENPVVQPPLAVRRGGHLFLPIVTSRLDLMAHLDILFLRPGTPGSVIIKGGDIDNRLKTLFDALQIPDDNQVGADPPRADEQPFFCALENDVLITRVNVETDRLLKPDEHRVGERSVAIHPPFGGGRSGRRSRVARLRPSP